MCAGEEEIIGSDVCFHVDATVTLEGGCSDFAETIDLEEAANELLEFAGR